MIFLFHLATELADPEMSKQSDAGESVIKYIFILLEVFQTQIVSHSI
jgi:hypothetical protein